MGGAAAALPADQLRQMEAMERELQALRREKAALENAAAETPALGAALAGQAGGGGLSGAEVAALRAKVAKLQEKLAALSAEDEGADGGWDGQLASAQAALRAAGMYGCG
jgi:cell division protein FtsB